MSDEAFFTSADIPTLRRLHNLMSSLAATEEVPVKQFTFGFVADLCDAYLREIEGGAA